VSDVRAVSSIAATKPASLLCQPMAHEKTRTAGRCVFREKTARAVSHRTRNLVCGPSCRESAPQGHQSACAVIKARRRRGAWGSSRWRMDRAGKRADRALRQRTPSEPSGRRNPVGAISSSLSKMSFPRPEATSPIASFTQRRPRSAVCQPESSAHISPDFPGRGRTRTCGALLLSQIFSRILIVSWAIVSLIGSFCSKPS